MVDENLEVIPGSIEPITHADPRMGQLIPHAALAHQTRFVRKCRASFERGVEHGSYLELPAVAAGCAVADWSGIVAHGGGGETRRAASGVFNSLSWFARSSSSVFLGVLNFLPQLGYPLLLSLVLGVDFDGR